METEEKIGPAAVWTKRQRPSTGRRRRLGCGVLRRAVQQMPQLGELVARGGQVAADVDGGLYGRYDDLRVAVARPPDKHLRVVGVGRIERVLLQTNRRRLVQHVRTLLLHRAQHPRSFSQRVWGLHLYS